MPEFVKIVKALPGGASNIILCHGVFDVLHTGHITHLRQAKSLGDFLAVSITDDMFVHKGPGRPINTAQDRATLLEALSFVDAVAIVSEPSAIPAIKFFRPQCYVKGQEYAQRATEGKLALEKEAIEQYGGKLVFTETPRKSSTALINYMKGKPISRTVDEIFDWLNRAWKLRALILGERILDQYIPVTAMGRSPKEELIVYEQKAKAPLEEAGIDTYQGGSEIILAHAKEAMADAQVINSSGEIHKIRFLSNTSGRKIFSYMTPPEVPPFYIPDSFDCDLLIVADFGHGLIRGKSRANIISKRAKFLALTVQSNGSNWGFNLLTKWSHADYFVADEMELRLARSDRWSPTVDLLEEEWRRLGAKCGAVTLGHSGCLVYDGKNFVTIPALTDKVVDTLGAGDAFLAWTAGLACLGAPADIIGFVGNVAGGIKVGLKGNQPVTDAEVREWIKGLLG